MVWESAHSDAHAVAPSDHTRSRTGVTEAARLHPGSHPNIDRLFHIIDSGEALQVQLVQR